jgi:hypothetical protein
LSSSSPSSGPCCRGRSPYLVVSHTVIIVVDFGVFIYFKPLLWLRWIVLVNCTSAHNTYLYLIEVFSHDICRRDDHYVVFLNILLSSSVRVDTFFIRNTLCRLCTARRLHIISDVVSLHFLHKLHCFVFCKQYTSSYLSCNET